VTAITTAIAATGAKAAAPTGAMTTIATS
jgi:hypothetical protein